MPADLQAMFRQHPTCSKQQKIDMSYAIGDANLKETYILAYLDAVLFLADSIYLQTKQFDSRTFGTEKRIKTEVDTMREYSLQELETIILAGISTNKLLAKLFGIFINQYLCDQYNFMQQVKEKRCQ